MKKQKTTRSQTLQPEFPLADRPVNLTDSEVSKIKDSLIESNKTFQAGQIKNFVDEWRNITSDRWIIDIVLGAKIEFEDVLNLPISLQKHNKQLSSIEKTLFRKEIARLRNRGVTLKNQKLHLSLLSF